MQDRRFSRQLRFLGAVLHAHETLAEHTRALTDLLRLMLEQAQQQELFAQVAMTAPPPPVRADDSDPPTAVANLSSWPVVDTLSGSLANPPLVTRAVPRFTPEVFCNYIRETWAEAHDEPEHASVRAMLGRGVAANLISQEEADALLVELGGAG